MKTAMQEFRDNLKAMQIDGIIGLSPTEEEMITYMFNIALEKEKEHLMMAFNDGKVNAVLKKRTSEEYYNQTYNQSK
jgi:hypothetical protein